MNSWVKQNLLGKCGLFALAFLFVMSVSQRGAAASPNESTESDEPSRTVITGTTMGPIPFSVVITNDENTPDENQLAKLVDEQLEHVNQLMSTYKEDSDVSRFNRAQANEWVDVHPDTVAVVARSLEISELTDSAFDITVGPAVLLWNFGPAKDKKFAVPSDQELKKVRAIVGWKKLEVRNDPPAIRKLNEGVQIDLSAIAKGYAVDRVAKALAEVDCNNLLVEVGGEVVAKGTPAGKPHWRVGVEKPQKGFSRDIEEVAELSNAGMATSGDYRNFKIKDGKKYSHTIDPSSCEPALNRLATVCVVAADCMTADALATGLMVMGEEKAWEFCMSNGIPVLLMARTSSDPLQPDQFKKRISDDFPLARAVEDTETAAQESAVAKIIPVFIGTVIVFALAILGMAAGAIFGNKQLQGSCGGLAAMGARDGETSCQICENPVTDCKETA